MGKYDPWEEYFRQLPGQAKTLSFGDLEEIIAAPLPKSAREYQVWWSSVQYQAVWAAHGWKAKADLRGERVHFTRAEDAGSEDETVTPPDESENRAQTSGQADERLVLLGCVKSKRNEPAPAKDLYVSTLWKKRRRYAEDTGMPWRILSSEHGLLQPDEHIEPYDREMSSETSRFREKWSRRTAKQVIRELNRLGLMTVELHAGASYIDSGLARHLRRASLEVIRPLEGLRQGEQLAWYDTRSDTPPVSAARQPPPPDVAPIERPYLQDARRIGPFEFQWPDATEHFDYGWEGGVILSDKVLTFKHGVGHRHTYGTERWHTVTWLGSSTIVEGVAADDYAASQSLLSTLKYDDGSMIRDHARVPSGYAPLHVVDHRSEIDAPYSRRGLAVKIRVDDVAGWALHAWLRTRSSSQVVADRAPSSRTTSQAAAAREPQDHAVPPSVKKAVVGRLLQLALAETAKSQATTGANFANDPEANALVLSDPFAFLVAVIADQGVPAERAWALPLELSRRMGHLDPHRVADEQSVRRAFLEPTPLHRYVEKIPRWIVDAAERVEREYGGDAGTIWGDEPTAEALRDRLEQFPGIGQKKAAMAVEILERDLGVSIQDMEGSDIAYDVHVRRVFLRTGIAERDDMEHMVESARSLHPERPGAIDMPAWVVGRNWCRPTSPDCPACALTDVCPKLIGQGDHVQGA